MSADAAETTKQLHASCVAFEQKAVLIAGASGSGKSTLALELLGLGARLIADDLTTVERQGRRVFALAPPRLRGVIEARNVGLIRAPFLARAQVCLVVDLEKNEPERLPHNHVTDLLGLRVETIYKVEASHFPAAIRNLVLFGRYA